MSIENGKQKFDRRYWLPPSIDPQFRKEFIDAPRHLGFPTRNHWAFLRTVNPDINPAQERGVWKTIEVEYIREDPITRREIPFTPEEIAEVLKHARTLAPSTNGKEMTVEEAIRSLKNKNAQASSLASLDAPLTSEDETSLLAFIPAPNERDIESNDTELRQELITIMQVNLPPREADVLIRRFGIFIGKPQTLEEIGEIYGLTKERIRQIERRALSRLGRKTIFERLRPYLE